MLDILTLVSSQNKIKTNKGKIMDFRTSVETCLKKKYACITGRATRSEYWYFQLFYFILALVSGLIGVLLSYVSLALGDLPSLILSLALLAPVIGVAIRRLHDLNKSGWFLLLALIPFVGAIALIVLFCLKGTEGDNSFGSPSE